jgi:hypothetical protein
MKKLNIKQIPTAILNWCDDLDDFWLTRFIRSIGYTRDELVELANKNIEIKRALRLAIDSLVDKVIYRTLEGYCTPEFADFMIIFYSRNFDFVKSGKIINIDLTIDPDLEKNNNLLDNKIYNQ